MVVNRYIHNRLDMFCWLFRRMSREYTVTVPDEQAEWLDDQPHLDPSSLLQQAIREQRQRESSQKDRQKRSQGDKMEQTEPYAPDTTNDNVLTVEKHYPNDAGRGIIRVDPDMMAQIEADPGDIVEIEGRATTVAKAWRVDRQDWGTQTTRIDAFTRQNAKIDIGEHVMIQTIEPAPADRVVLTPSDEANEQFNADATEMIKRQLLKRPVVEGDYVPIMHATNHSSMRSPKQTEPFIAAETTPNEVVLITDETTIELQTE